MPKKNFCLSDQDIASAKEIHDTEKIASYKAVSDYEFFVRHCMEAGKDVLCEFEKLASLNPDIIIISSEIGSGIIPVSKTETLFRETAGRVMCKASAQAQNVYRVVCGIGVKIK